MIDDTAKRSVRNEAVRELAGRFGIAPDSFSLIQDIRNFIYRYPLGGGEAVFKVLPSPGEHERGPEAVSE